jgi:hypothetical protein
MPGTRRNFAGVSGSPGSVQALRQAAQLAHNRDALPTPVLAWLPPDSRRLPPGPSCARSGATTPGSACGTPSMPPSAACPAASPPSPPCCAATPARC